MKKILIFIITVILLFGLFFIWVVNKEIKSEKSELKEKILIKKQKEYMSKIDSISLFGIFLREDVNKHLGTFQLDENGIYQTPKFEGYDVNTAYFHKNFTTGISPNIKNENFIDYYVAYDPYSRVIYKIIGVLPKKFIDLVPNDLEKTEMSKSLLASKYHKNCEDYLKPLIEVISDGIKNKTDLLPVPIENMEGKRISIQYKMNSGLGFLDQHPQNYFGLKTRGVSSYKYDEYKTTVLELTGHCNAFRPKENLYISLTHKVIEDYMVSSVVLEFNKKINKQKISEDEIKIKKKKSSIDKTGLQ
jgi:hypothetical protein|tara:strand:+ start:41 stop:949 length:909 start_codon:yes stop_codon:yes gene_type:complete